MRTYTSTILALLITAGCGNGENNETPSDTGMSVGDTNVSADMAQDDDATAQTPDMGAANSTDMATADDMAVSDGGGSMALATDCPDSPDEGTICVTVEGQGTQVVVIAAGLALSGNTAEADANLQDNMSIQVPIDVARVYDCTTTPDGSPDNPVISINLGVNIYAGDDTSSGWVGGNVIPDPVCEIEFTTAAAGSGDVYEGSFSATLIRAISVTETDPSQTLRIAGTFRGIRP